MHRVALGHATPVSCAAVSPAGVAAGRTDQVEPFHCSAAGSVPYAVCPDPTVTQFVPVEHARLANSLQTGASGSMPEIADHVPPFQWAPTTTSLLAAPRAVPTAVQLVAKTQSTPDKYSSVPLGGGVVSDQAEPL
jgi:hypothetical protein